MQTIKLLADSATTNSVTLSAPNASGLNLSGLNNISVPGAIQALLVLILIVATVAFFFMLIIGGIRWILSGGDKGQTEAARNQITAALIGLVVVFAAWAIASLIGSLFGIGVFSGSLTLPTL